jgi:hypothetical protein
MPSIFTLEGPKLDCLSCQKPVLAGPSPTAVRWLHLGAAFIVGAAGFLVYNRARKGKPLFGLRGLGDPKRIASESRTIEEYARRVEAWNAGEAKPQSLTKLAKAWRGGKEPWKVMKLLREARESREEGRQRLWSKMSHGLRGGCSIQSVDPKQLRIGTSVEMEHTKSRKVARKIALTHLCESPRYYRAGREGAQEHLLLKPSEYRKLARGLRGNSIFAIRETMFRLPR